MPDLYLNELRLELLETCGVSVSLATIWRTLIKGGYTMKKVCDYYNLPFKLLTLANSSLAQRLSAVRRNDLNMQLVLEPMIRISLFL